MKRALVTGAAGFVGYHIARRLLAEGWAVTGLDAITDYYDVSLKQARLDRLTAKTGFSAVRGAVESAGLVARLFAETGPDLVVHLAAQAGVRHSIEAPRMYLEANIAGTFEILEAARAHPPAHMLLASTSSVYGMGTALPYAETERTDRPVSFYAATKKATEAMAHSYAHLYDLPVTMFRFFTVYGPWGRPDMAPMLFARAILAGEAIRVFNHGRMRRDFTFINDLVEAMWRLVEVPPVRPEGLPEPGDSLSPVAPFRIVNIGNAAPVELLDFIAALEAALGREARHKMEGMQPGDVVATWADTSLLERLTGYVPSTDIETGTRAFAEWYMSYYGPHAS